MSETPQKILVRQWISRAENDLLNVRNNLAAQEIPWDTICFHSQQAAEKYLKAVLVFYAQPVPRTHDLEHLLSMVVQWIPQIQEQREALRWLTTFAVASRYPVETVEGVDEPQGRRSLDIAQAIRRDCRAYLMKLEPTLFDQSTTTPASRPSSSA